MVDITTEPFFEIDLNSRIISVPEVFKENGIGVIGDQRAETLWFVCASSFDGVSLTGPSAQIIIQYENALGKQYLYEATSNASLIENNKIKFAWLLDSFVTASSGNIIFNIRFIYKDNNNIDRILNTQSQTLTINPSLEFDNELAIFNINNYEYDTSIISSDINNTITQVNFDYNENNCYQIDLDKRTITTPNFIGVAYDHNIHTIYFSCDKIFDGYNLSNGNCVIQYINANGDQGCYYIPRWRVVNDKIIIPWKINGLVTAYSGRIYFNIRFYKTALKAGTSSTDIKNYYYEYNLETQPVQTQVLSGLKLSMSDFIDYYQEVSIQDVTSEAIQTAISEAQIAWRDL